MEIFSRALSVQEIQAIYYADYAGKCKAPATVQLGQTTYQVSEGVGTLNVAVTRSGDPSVAVSVDYTTNDGTATAGSDYGATSGTLNFAPGESIQVFPVTITDDSVAEGEETFSVTLDNASGGIMGQTRVGPSRLRQ